MENSWINRKWLRDGRLVYELMDNPEPSKGRPEQVNRWSASVQPGHGVREEECERIAGLLQMIPELLELVDNSRFYLTGEDLDHSREDAALAKANYLLTGEQPVDEEAQVIAIRHVGAADPNADWRAFEDAVNAEIVQINAGYPWSVSFMYMDPDRGAVGEVAWAAAKTAGMMMSPMDLHRWGVRTSGRGGDAVRRMKLGATVTARRVIDTDGVQGIQFNWLDEDGVSIDYFWFPVVK